MGATTTRSTFSWVPGTTSGERVAATAVLAALAFTAAMALLLLTHQWTVDAYHAAPTCSTAVSDACVSSRPGTVTAAPKQYRFGLESDGRASRHTARPNDAGALDLLRAGTPIIVREWRGHVVEVTVDGTVIPTDEHPEQEMSVVAAWLTAVALTIPMTLLIAYCVRCAAQNARAPRDAAARAGDYAIPYVAEFHQFRTIAICLTAAGAAFAAYAVLVDQRFGLVMLALNVVALVMFWAISRNRVTLEREFLSYRRLARERAIRYEEIASVSPVWNVYASGRGVTVIVLLRLGLRRASPLDVHLTTMAERDRAVIVDRLQRHARNATFDQDLHRLWTGSY